LAAASDFVASYLEGVGERPVVPPTRPGEVRAALPQSPPERPEPFESILRDVETVIAPALTHWNHPRFFAYFGITGSEPGILAELLTATFNINAMAWSTSPAATELEQVVLDWLAQLLGLPREWHGHIEDTASTSTVAALAAARTLRPGGVVYASEQAHFSIEKAARILGLEFRPVPTDDDFCMTTDFGLHDATAVVATVGTTSSTSVDPVPVLADRCEEADVWLHVDAAYAGSAAVCPELRWCLDGCDRADSVVVNPHKWLFTPIDCSALWTRRPEALRAAFAAHGDYLRSSEGAIDLRDYGPALGRRFRALKLWMVLRCFGREGLQALIREHVRLAALFEEWVRADPVWEIVAPRHFSTVCFRHLAADNDEIARSATATGELFVATTKLRGQTVIRLAIGNARTREADVRRAWEVLRRCAP
jgi:aromatic-L-amino-acid/L-tryptophan decarboxylase